MVTAQDLKLLALFTCALNAAFLCYVWGLAVWQEGFKKGVGTVMRKWEYKILSPDFAWQEAQLDALGKEGWELCADLDGKRYFKREIPGPWDELYEHKTAKLQRKEDQ